jgi:ADP-ribose pyrophosphatase YjhB (NUDIX family)
MTRESDFFAAVAARNVVRSRVAGIIIADNQLLAQKPSDDPAACYAFIGGEYEVGDTFVSRLHAEIEEETTARCVRAEYLFVVENQFKSAGVLVHGLEHYLLAEINRADVQSREPHLVFHWLPLDELAQIDMRPHVVRDAIVSGAYLQVRHLIVPRGDQL